jgi:hypothetical protein
VTLDARHPGASSPAERLRILVSGRIAATPHQGGATWAVLQYLLGLRELGHDVWFVEAIPAAQLRPAGAELACSLNAAYAARVLSGLGFAGRWALFREGTTHAVGLSYRSVAATRFDVHVNVSGCVRDDALTDPIPVRIYLDLDPAFTQVWHGIDGHDLGLGGHTHFATVGCGIGTPECPVPTGGIHWHHTLPPVVLSHWTPGAEITRPAMTTVANWRSYGSTECDGVAYGQRAHSFRAFFELPHATPVALAPALAIDPGEVDDLAALARGGWTLVDPAVVAGTPDAYREFVRASRGELSIAKSGYVASRSGWFSDRSACYLASGRPVVAQDTGFGRRLPTGVGLLTFSTPAEAIEALERVDADYARHAAAARRVAADELDSATVLADLLRYAGVCSD